MYASPINSHFDQFNPFGSQLTNPKELIERFFESAISQDQFNLDIDGGRCKHEVLMQIHTMYQASAFNSMLPRYNPQPEFVKFTVYADPPKMENIELIMACVFVKYVAIRPNPENNSWGGYQVNGPRKALNLLAIRKIEEFGVPGKLYIAPPLQHMTIKSGSVEVAFGMPVMIPASVSIVGHGPEAGLSGFHHNQQHGPGWSFAQNPGGVGVVTPVTNTQMGEQAIQDIRKHTQQEGVNWTASPPPAMSLEDMLKDPRTGELPSGFRKHRGNDNLFPSRNSSDQ